MHNHRVRQQFDLRSSTFDRSVHWVTDPVLVAAHVDLAGPLPPGTKKKSLELCCGTGAVSRGLKRAGWDAQGIDISEGMIREAARYISAQVGDVARLPFADATFDLAVMRQAYFLLDDGPAALREVKRVLRPGGRFILSHLVPFSELDAPYLRQVHEVKQAQMRQFHTIETLEKALRDAGFEVGRRATSVVRESVTLWMDQAPELSPATRAKVCAMVAEAPEPYRRLHRVEVRGDEITEDWNFVLIPATPL